MLLAVIALGIGFCAGLASGGDPRNLARTRLRGLWLLLIGAGLDVAGGTWGSGWLGLAALITGYALLVAFALLNVRLTGMVLVVAGILANLTVVAVNSGMPVRGVPAGVSFGALHHGAGPGDSLSALGDVVRLAPIGETVSAGDLVLSLGVATTVAGVMLGRRRLRA